MLILNKIFCSLLLRENIPTYPMKRTCLFFVALYFALSGFSQNPEITVAELRQHLYVLASDSLEGRKPGEAGGDKAAAYIQKNFASNLLQLADDKGLAPFQVITGLVADTGNRFEINGFKPALMRDYVPASWSASAKVEAKAVNVGYGFQVKHDSIARDDYENAVIEGKWAVVFRGIPADERHAKVLSGFSSDRDKALLAKDKGAVGVVFIDNPAVSGSLPPLAYDRGSQAMPFPVVYVSHQTAYRLFGIPQITDSLKAKAAAPSQVLTGQLKVKVDLRYVETTTHNVWAVIRGSNPALRDEYIVVGAHYDHLGFGGPGSGSRMPDTLAVHYGADDNASGVSAVMELAAYLKSRSGELGRSIIVVAFGAEEMGLLGSTHFVANLPVAAGKIRAMINFDMIGRLNPETRSFSIGGTGTAPELVPVLDSLLNLFELKAAYSPEGFGPSDHAPFYGAGIPVVYMNTGVHTDYHTPFDTPDRINYEGLAELTRFSSRLVVALSNIPSLTFTEAGPSQRGNNRQRLKVTFGLMPDFTAADVKGLRISAVTPGGPAAGAGLMKGDIITAIDGKPVGEIYEYMSRLKALNPGQRVSVDVNRNNENLVFILEL